MSITGERRKCPAEFQDRLTRNFGKNQFGSPRFKIVWGQSQFIRLGNLWRDKNGRERVGYRDRYQAHGMPCWVIMRWQPPTKYGSPNIYYANSYMAAATHDDGEKQYDSPEGFYVTGEYPWRGRYEIVQALISKEMVDGKLVVTHFPLSHFLIDRLIPMMLAFERLTAEEQAVAKAATKAAEEKETTEFIADYMEESLPRWWGPVSYGGQGIRTSLLDRKMHQISQVWDHMSRRGLRQKFSLGMQQGNSPVVRN
jgi:hypothetical protein